MPPAYGYGMPPPGYGDPQAAERYRQDQQRYAEDAKKRQDEDAKRAKDQKKRREEEQKRKKEEADKRREEAAKQKKEAEEKRKKEQQATMAIRRIIQKIRLATPENFEEVKKELEDILTVELEHCGGQLTRIKEESDKGLEQAQKRIEALSEARKKEQERREAEQKKREEQEARAKELIKELTDLVECAEASAERLKDMSAPLNEGDVSIEEVETCAAAVEEAGGDAKAATKVCTDFILEHGAEMKDPLPAVMMPGMQTTVSETKQLLAKLLQRINECGKTAESLMLAARGAKDSAVRRVAARKKTKEMEALFAKYDKDKDHALSQTEASSYAKKEMSTTLDKELLAKIWRSAVDEGQKGVVMDRMYLLNSGIGIAREMQRNEKRRQERLAKEKIMAGLRDKLRIKVKEVEAFVTALEKELSRIEEAVAPLMAKACTTSIDDMIREANKCDNMIKVCRDGASKVRQKVNAIPSGFDKKYEEDLKEAVAIEAKYLELRMGRTNLRLDRAARLSGRYREQALKRRIREIEKTRVYAMAVARQHARVHSLSLEELFSKFDKNGDGAIDEKDFFAFFASVDKDLKEDEFSEDEAPETEPKEEAKEGEAASDEKPAEALAVAAPKAKPKPPPLEKVELTNVALKSFFGSVLDQGATKLSKQAFERLAKVYYKVVKETPMTENLEVNGSSMIRQLKLGEVVELLEGPSKEVSMKVFRARAKVIGDDKEGWVTVAGNQGTVFLKEGAHHWKVLRETQPSASFEDATPKQGLRKIKDGEVVEVIEWPKKDEESGLTRCQVRAKLDGVTGWITSIGKDGAIRADVL